MGTLPQDNNRDNAQSSGFRDTGRWTVKCGGPEGRGALEGAQLGPQLPAERVWGPPRGRGDRGGPRGP